MPVLDAALKLLIPRTSRFWRTPGTLKSFWKRSADFQSAVSRISNPLAVTDAHAPDVLPACRLEVGDTAGWETCATRTVSRRTRARLAQGGDETLPVVVIQKNQLPPVTAIYPVR